MYTDGQHVHKLRLKIAFYKFELKQVISNKFKAFWHNDYWQTVKKDWKSFKIHEMHKYIHENTLIY